jgi:hypothetical protein
MYVIFPAEEVVELTLRGIASHQHLQHHLLEQRYQQHVQQVSDAFSSQQRRDLGEPQNLPRSPPSRRGEISCAELLLVPSHPRTLAPSHPLQHHIPAVKTTGGSADGGAQDLMRPSNCSSMYLILPAALWSGFYLAPIRNEYKKSSLVRAEVWPAHKSEILTAMSEWIFQTVCDPRGITHLWAATASYGDSFTHYM